MDKNNPLVIKKRGEDGNRVISIRLREDILERIDQIAKECNHSRNELINLMLEYSVDNIRVE